MADLARLAPPFSSRRQCLAFCAIVCAVGALTMGLRVFDAPAHEGRLLAAPQQAGPYSFLQRQIFEETAPIDLAFVGDSLLWVGVDARAVEIALSRSLGRPARVVTLAWNWRGDDLTYYVLRDLLQRRRVDHVVLRLGGQAAFDAAPAPHPMSYVWMSACRHDAAAPSLPWPDRIAVAGIEVTGALRRALSLVRPNRRRASPYEATNGSNPWERGPVGESFVSLSLPPIAPAAADVLSSAQAPRHVCAAPEPASAYQRAYVDATRRLLEAHGVKVALLRLPLEHERQTACLPAGDLWPSALGPGTAVLAVAPPRLFAGLTPAQVHQLYYDREHFNRNGNALFTGALLPALTSWVSRADAP